MCYGVSGPSVGVGLLPGLYDRLQIPKYQGLLPIDWLAAPFVQSMRANVSQWVRPAYTVFCSAAIQQATRIQDTAHRDLETLQYTTVHYTIVE